MIRVALIEDNVGFRQAVELVLSVTPGFEHAASFGSVAQLRAALGDPRARAGAWDVALFDLELPGQSGLDGVRALKARHPGVRAVVCTVFEEPATVLAAIGAGADGYIVKGAPLDALLEQIRVVADGGATLSPSVARALLDAVRRGASAPAANPSRLDLTDREREVLRCLVDGASYKQAAATLGISENTVRTHIKALYKKLQVQNVAEAVSRAVREGLV
jgi:DNA-binding NarL/FixJ family response regulator